MTAREKKVKQEDKSAASGYLKKASDNYDQMLAAFHASNWNAAATLAVQCAISSADAICVHEKGIRSISQNHQFSNTLKYFTIAKGFIQHWDT